MGDETEGRKDLIDEATERSLELPARVLTTYALLWQLETWLRRMVYVELRALCGDGWKGEIRTQERSLAADKELSHMPTIEEDPLSYATLSELLRIVGVHWRLFSGYLPPQDIWNARMKEVSQIRHRVAHFRRGHDDDLSRIVQLLRDVDKGFWTFCTSYNNSWPALRPEKDSVSNHFRDLDPLPYVEIEPKKWARIGHVDKSIIVAVTVHHLRRPWAESEDAIEEKPGYLYDLQLYSPDQRSFDYPKFLEASKHAHSHLVHLCLDAFSDAVRVTIPTILGTSRVIEIVEELINVARYTVFRGPTPDPDDRSVQLLADGWPEYVLGPENPLTFLAPDNPCRFFTVDL